MKQKVTATMNVGLQKQFTREEIREALQQMAPLKSLGPDSFNVCFYQAYWDIIGDKVCSIVLNFLNGGMFDDLIILHTLYLFLRSKILCKLKILDL